MLSRNIQVTSEAYSGFFSNQSLTKEELRYSKRKMDVYFFQNKGGFAGPKLVHIIEMALRQLCLTGSLTLILKMESKIQWFPVQLYDLGAIFP